MEFKVVLTADDKLLAAINGLTNAITGGVVQNVTTVQPSQSLHVEKEDTSKATKRTYLLHEESGAAIIVNKGEELACHFEQGLEEITKAEYDHIQAEKMARINKTKESAEPETGAEPNENAKQTTEPVDHGITMEMIRAEATKLTSNGRQADFKAILTSFEAPKLSAVPEEKYPDLLTAIKEAVGEA